MNEPREDAVDKPTGGLTPARYIHLALAVFLAAGAVDSLIALVFDIEGQGSFLSLFGQIAVAGALAVGAYVVASAVLALFAGLMGRRPTDISLFVGLAVGLLVFMSAVLITGLNSFSELRENAVLAALRLMTGLGAALFAVFVVRRYVMSERTRVLSPAKSISMLAFLGPFLTLTAAVIVAVDIWAVKGYMLPILFVLGVSVLIMLLPLPKRFASLRTTLVLLLVVGTATTGAALGVREYQNIGVSPYAEDDTTEKPIPRVVFISIDTLRRDALGVYEGTLETSAIDAFAQESTVFRNAYSASPWTVPSFASMFTGVCADIHGQNEFVGAVPERFPTLAELFTAAGYKTAAIGRHPNLIRMGRGFSNFDFYPKPVPWHRESIGGKLFWKVFYEEMPTGTITDRACSWLERNADEEFFLWVHYLEPHHPYAPPLSYVRDVAGVDVFGPRFVDYAGVRGGSAAQSQEERQWMHDLYNECVRYTDDEVGRLLECLKSLGIYDDALIVLTADHGEEFWDHNDWEHGHSLYNELVRIPFMIRLPGQRTQNNITTSVTNTSIMPTLIDLCGLQAPEDFSPTVHSLAASCSGEEPEAEPIFISKTKWYGPQEGVIFGQYKFTRHLLNDDIALYDLEQDPQEKHNIASVKPEVLQQGIELLAKRAEFRKTYDAGSAERSHPRAEEPTIDRALQEQLRNLGYVD